MHSTPLAARADPSELREVLSEGIRELGDLGGAFAEARSRLNGLQSRLAEGELHLAVLGQLKRGKSTLLNALVGEALLPTAVVPLTSIPTVLRSGAAREATIRFRDGRAPETVTTQDPREIQSFLSRFVTESQNPENRLGVVGAEIRHPVPLLAEGVTLIDTPGIGSTFRHNTETTLRFLPRCDAGIFVVSADPPLTEVELEFLEQTLRRIPRLFFVLNKIDYLNTEDRRTATAFLREQLCGRLGLDRDVPIFRVSARAALEASVAGDTTAWRQSGIAEIQTHLIQFLAREKSQTLVESVERRSAEIIDDVLLRLRLAARTLELPLEDLEQRLETFERKLGEVETERQIARDRLAGDRKRVHAFLEEHAEALRRSARDHLQAVIRETCAGRRDGETREKTIQAALATSIPHHFAGRRESTAERVRERMARVLQPHRERADRLQDTIRRTAAEIFDVPYPGTARERIFEWSRDPSWKTREWSTGLRPLPRGALDWLLPRGLRTRRMLRRIDCDIEALIRQNVESLRWAAYQSIDESFRRFTASLDDQLAQSQAATRGAIRAALERRRTQRHERSPERTRLADAIDRLVLLRARLEIAGKASPELARPGS